MPIDYKKNYVGWWHQFSKYIRTERAKNKCEKCGAPNGKIVGRGWLDWNTNAKTGIPVWHDSTTSETFDARDGYSLGCFRDYELNLQRDTKIVLTVAHLDFDGGICRCKEMHGIKCAIPSHCLALCQACHLQMDMPHHIKKRRAGLAEKKDAERTLLAGA
jgi:hypothetical protein